MLPALPVGRRAPAGTVPARPGPGGRRQVELVLQKSPARSPARHSAVPCPQSCPQPGTGQERGQRDRSAPRPGQPRAEMSHCCPGAAEHRGPPPREGTDIRHPGCPTAAGSSCRLLPGTGKWGWGSVGSPNPRLQRGLRERQRWHLAKCRGEARTPQLRSRLFGQGGSSSSGHDGHAEQGRGACLAFSWVGGWTATGCRGCREGSPSSSPCLAIPGGEGRQQPNCRVYFPPVSSILTCHSKPLKHMLTENVYKQEKRCSFASNCEAIL